MKIAVIGAGSWGTAISGVAAAKAGEVMLWSHDEPVPPSINERHVNPLYLTDYTLPENVRATCSFEEALEGAAGAIVVVPSPFIRSTIRSAARYVADDLPILCLTKGIEPHTGKLMHEVIAEELGSPERIAALTGPRDSVERQRLLYQERRDALCDGLEAIGWERPNAHGSMFVWARTPGGRTDSMAFALELMERSGVIVTPGASFGPSGEGYVRMALVMPPDELREAVAAIAAAGM